MIKLGLPVPMFNRRKAFLPNVLQALLETAAWCSSAALQSVRLRSPALDPSDLLEGPSFDDLGVLAWSTAKLASYQRAIAEIN
jgi:hypothetical protein